MARKPTIEGGGRIIKRRMRTNKTNLTSPQRASLRQLIQKRKICMLKPLECIRTVEFARSPDENYAECNKIIFACALGLLPVKGREAVNDGDIEAGCAPAIIAMQDEMPLLHRKKFRAYQDMKKRINIVTDALTLMLIKDDETLAKLGIQAQSSESGENCEGVNEDSGTASVGQKLSAPDNVSDAENYVEDASVSKMASPMQEEPVFTEDTELKKSATPGGKTRKRRQRESSKLGFRISEGEFNGTKIKFYASSSSLGHTIDEVARGYTFNMATGTMEPVNSIFLTRMG